jgi:hypothetical protein
MTATAIHTTGSDHRSRKARAAHFLRRAAESFEMTEFAAVNPARGPQSRTETTAGESSTHNFTNGGAGSSR